MRELYVRTRARRNAGHAAMHVAVVISGWAGKVHVSGVVQWNLLG